MQGCAIWAWVLELRYLATGIDMLECRVMQSRFRYLSLGTWRQATGIEILECGLMQSEHLVTGIDILECIVMQSGPKYLSLRTWRRH